MDNIHEPNPDPPHYYHVRYDAFVFWEVMAVWDHDDDQFTVLVFSPNEQDAHDLIKRLKSLTKAQAIQQFKTTKSTG